MGAVGRVGPAGVTLQFALARGARGYVAHGGLGTKGVQEAVPESKLLRARPNCGCSLPRE